MKNNLLLITAIFSLSGCAQMFPARVAEINPGVYMLQATGNMFASNASLEQKIDRKASAICKGSGFDVLQNNAQQHQQTSYSNGLIIGASFKTLNKTIQCRQL